MTDRPILFSAPMVQAIRAGRKTQTRRIAKPRTRNSLLDYAEEGEEAAPDGARWTDGYVLDLGNREWLLRDAAAQPGDRFRVKENYRLDAICGKDLARACEDTPVHYEADGQPGGGWGHLRPSIHMPTWAVRLYLPNVTVRLERLHQITEADAMAEGIIERMVITSASNYGQGHIEHQEPRFFWGEADDGEGAETAVDAYEALWVRLNGQASWDANPRVWVYGFDLPE